MKIKDKPRLSARITASIMIPVLGCLGCRSNFTFPTLGSLKSSSNANKEISYTHQDMADNYDQGFTDGYKQGAEFGSDIKYEQDFYRSNILQAHFNSIRKRDRKWLTDKLNLIGLSKIAIDYFELKGNKEMSEYFKEMLKIYENQAERIEKQWALEGIIIDYIRSKKKESK